MPTKKEIVQQSKLLKRLEDIEWILRSAQVVGFYWRCEPKAPFVTGDLDKPGVWHSRADHDFSFLRDAFEEEASRLRKELNIEEE